jgi:hypothetical protein
VLTLQHGVAELPVQGEQLVLTIRWVRQRAAATLRLSSSSSSQ